MRITAPRRKRGAVAPSVHHFMLLMLPVLILGVSYALWSDVLKVKIEINTGDLDSSFTGNIIGVCGFPQRWGMDLLARGFRSYG